MFLFLLVELCTFCCVCVCVCVCVCEVAGIKINENDEINEIAPFSLLSVVVVLFPVLDGRRNCFWRFRYSQLSANFLKRDNDNGKQ